MTIFLHGDPCGLVPQVKKFAARREARSPANLPLLRGKPAGGGHYRSLPLVMMEIV